MRLFFSTIFTLIVSSAEAQPPFQSYNFVLPDSVETIYRIEYSAEKGLEIKTFTLEYFSGHVSYCDFGNGPDILGGIYRDEMHQFPNGAAFYLNGGFVQPR